MGRFLTPDPYRGSAHSADPRTWNRYAYTNGDPINFIDRTGLDGGFVAVCDPNDPTCDNGDDTDSDGSGGGWNYNYPCGENGLVEVPGQGCVAATDNSTDENEETNVITLQEVTDCTFAHGTSVSLGTFTLEVEYQVLDNGSPVYGNSALNALGISISESVVSSNITGNGKWCPVDGPCGRAEGSMSPNGMFWDILAGNGTATQTFLLNGQPIPVVNYPGSPTVLQNTYNSKGQSISVGNGAVVGNSTTRACGTKKYDPTAK